MRTILPPLYPFGASPDTDMRERARLPRVRQLSSGAYFAKTRSWASLTSPSRIRLSPLTSRKPRAVSENAATSVNSVLTFASRSSSVPVVLIVLSRIWAISGITAA